MSRDEEFEKLKSEVIEFKHQIEMRTTEHEFSVHKHTSEYKSKINDQFNELKNRIYGGLVAGFFAILLILFPDFFNL